MHKCMDWRSVKFDWNRARAFLVTAEEGSLSAAARALGLAQPTLGRQVTALEDELGVALFERGTRGLELTPSGLELIEHVRAMGDAASKLSLTASGQSQRLEGNVCITATEDMAMFDLPPMLRRFRDIEPGIVVEVIASNSTSDLQRREADIAIRGFRPTQKSLVAKRLNDVSYCLYAATSYLESFGPVDNHARLSEAAFVGFENNQTYIEVLKEMGVEATDANFRVKSESRIVQWELVKQGLGVGGFQCLVGDAEPGVERVPKHSEPTLGEVWLVAHRELKTSLRVRRVFDFLASELGG